MAAVRYTDRPGIRNVDLVEKLQDKVIQGLQAAMKQNHADGPSLFARLIMKVPDLRTLNTLHSEKLLALKMDPNSDPPTRAEIRSKTDRLFGTLAMGGLNQFNAMQAQNRPPWNHGKVTSSIQSGAAHQPNASSGPLPPIQRMWDHHPPSIVVANGHGNVKHDSLSPHSTTSDGSQISPSSLGTLKEFEMMRSKRDHDSTDLSSDRSSDGRSPKRDECELSDASDKTDAMEIGSVVGHTSDGKPTDSDGSESPKSSKSVSTGSSPYKPFKKFLADRATTEANENTAAQQRATEATAQVQSTVLQPVTTKFGLQSHFNYQQQPQNCNGLSHNTSSTNIYSPQQAVDHVTHLISSVNNLADSKAHLGAVSIQNTSSTATFLPSMASMAFGNGLSSMPQVSENCLPSVMPTSLFMNRPMPSHMLSSGTTTNLSNSYHSQISAFHTPNSQAMYQGTQQVIPRPAHERCEPLNLSLHKPGIDPAAAHVRMMVPNTSVAHGIKLEYATS